MVVGNVDHCFVLSLDKHLAAHFFSLANFFFFFVLLVLPIGENFGFKRILWMYWILFCCRKDPMSLEINLSYGTSRYYILCRSKLSGMCWTIPSPLWDSLEISSLILFYIDLGLLLFDLEKIEDIHVFEMIIREGLTSLFTL